MQRLTLIGNISTDIELSQTESGKDYCKFSVAVNRPYNKGTDFFPCIAWEKKAEPIAKYCKKGSKIYICGTIAIDTYKDKDGNNRTSVNVTVLETEFLSSNKSEPNADGTEEVVSVKKTRPVMTEVDENQLPF